jgi:hypothetical protein
MTGQYGGGRARFKVLDHANGVIVEIPSRKTKNHMQVAASPSLRAPEDAKSREQEPRPKFVSLADDGHSFICKVFAFFLQDQSAKWRRQNKSNEETAHKAPIACRNG